MGQHKNNPTAKLAVEGNLQRNPKKSLNSKEFELLAKKKIESTIYFNDFLKSKDIKY